MKYRKGFVTNSSSSSFIVAFKDISTIVEPTNKNFIYLKKINKLLEDKLILAEEDSWYGSYDGIILSTEYEFKEYFISHFIGSDLTIEKYFQIYPNKKKSYDKMLNYINNGYKIAFREISNCDENMQEFLSNMSDNDNFIILEEY